MILFQHVETACETLVGGAEGREIMQVLDPVVGVELRQNKLQPRHQQTRKFGRRNAAFVERPLDRPDHAGKLAKHGMARQPEARHLAEVGVAVPLLARVPLKQRAQIVRPAAAAGKRERVGVSGGGRPDVHGAYIAITGAFAKRCKLIVMNTIVARLSCDEPTARRLAAVLGESLDTEAAACGCFESDDGGWQMVVHFRDPPNEDAIRALVRVAAGDAAKALIFEPVGDTDWVTQSLAGLKPVRTGRFVVHGAHDRARVPINTIGIEIEAALAFGTGHHGTTRGCLIALDRLAKRRRARGTLDIGTGSGVLAIAAAKRFRRRVVASDIDPVAVQAARNNARLNRAAAFVSVARAAGANAHRIARGEPYDLIFANILLGPLLRLAVPIRRLAEPGARIVLSGLLPVHANAVLAIYRAQRLTLERRIVLDGWVTLVMRRHCLRRRPR